MAVFRSRRLSELLGASPDVASYSDFASLVSNKVSEASDLDFKMALYGTTDSQRRALAGDVAAMANTAGGILVLGIEEDDHARAESTPGVAISDGEVRRIRTIVGDLVSPGPAFDVLTVPQPGRPDHGFLVVAVPRSPLAPHAVLVDRALRYPLRNGTTTRYLSEPEVATAYRQRIARAEGQAERAFRVETAAMARLKQADDHVWVVVSLVPDLPGDLLIGQASLMALRTEMSRSAFPAILRTSLSWHRFDPAPRRLLLSGSPDSSLQTGWLAADLHSDGAGAFAMNAIDDTVNNLGGAATAVVAHDEQVVNAIMSGLRFLGRHARDRAGAGGDALIRAQIRRDDYAIRLGAGRRSFGDVTGHVLPIPGRAAEAAASLDSLAEDGPDLLAATYLLASEIFQEFGLPEAGQVTRDGQLRRAYWSGYRHPELEAWAAQAGVAVSDETLSG
jgi:hypothetical protein